MKAAIYLRVSTDEQDAGKQEASCLAFAQKRGYKLEGIYREQLSGWKPIARPKYEEIKQKAHQGKIDAVIVWALDRWVRNRDTLLSDIMVLKNCGCRLHSVQEAYLDSLNIDGALGRTITEFLLGLIGTSAEMESKRKSERIRMAFENHKGKKWGRPAVPDKTKKEIIKLHAQRCSYREISRKLKISLGSINKILKENTLH